MAGNISDTYTASNNVTNFIPISKVAISVSCLGLGLNLFIIIIITTNRCFRSFTYRLICVCAISDIVTNIMLTTNYSYNIYNASNVELGKWFCKIVFVTMSISYGVSIMTLCLIAIGHYMRITKSSLIIPPYMRNHGALYSEMIIIAFATSFSYPIFEAVNNYQDKPTFCDFINIDRGVSIYLIFHAFIFYLIPSFLLIIVYYKITCHMKKFNASIGYCRAAYKSRKKLIKMLITVTTLDVLITWPVFASTFAMAVTQTSIRELNDIKPVYFTLTMLSLTTTVIISIVNPISFLCLDAEIKKGSKEIAWKLAKIFRIVSILNLCRRHYHIHPISPINTLTVIEVHAIVPEQPSTNQIKNN